MIILNYFIKTGKKEEKRHFDGLNFAALTEN